MRSLILLLIAALTAVIAGAQNPSAALLGHVTDETGAPTAMARVEITSLETNETQSLATDSNGSFSAQQLPVGAYRIVIAKDGFRTLEQARIELELDETARLEFTMRPGDPAQKVLIAPTEIMMDTEDANVGDTANEEEIEETPLNGRDFQDL